MVRQPTYEELEQRVSALEKALLKSLFSKVLSGPADEWIVREGHAGPPCPPFSKAHRTRETA